jgi:hypothetical protein
VKVAIPRSPCARGNVQIIAWTNAGDTAIYRNGEYVRCDEYDGPAGHGCQAHSEGIHPAAANAPLRLGTGDLKSFFQGGLSQLRIWNRALGNEEVRKLFQGDIPQRGLVAEFLRNEGKGNTVHDVTGGMREKSSEPVGAAGAEERLWRSQA